ncbi:MAG: sugar O-acetyltransferase [Roseibium sp.]
MKTNYEKMLAGEPHFGTDPELFELQKIARDKKAAVDAIPPDDMEGRTTALKELFGSMKGAAIIMPPFTIEYGNHIHLGEWVFVNAGASFLDSNSITLGDFTAVGPNVQFITPTHPIKPEDRFQTAPEGSMLPFNVVNIARKITVGRECWIGAGAIIMPRVSIGDGTVVGAGSIVTKSLPDRVVAVGNPARILRTVD